MDVLYVDDDHPGYNGNYLDECGVPLFLHPLMVLDKLNAAEVRIEQWPPKMTPPPGHRKPAPALCVEAHRSEPIDADRARAATLAMCRAA